MTVLDCGPPLAKGLKTEYNEYTMNFVLALAIILVHSGYLYMTEP